MTPDADARAQAYRKGMRIAEHRVHATFDGVSFEGQQGDTVASSLLANGIRLFGRSIKYRRPRGVFTADVHEPNALVTVGVPPDLIPNVPATVLALEEGHQLFSQNRWPTLRYDVSSALQLAGGLLTAGFYYKTFIWPSWRTYEPVIRRLAGLGPAPCSSDLGPPSVEHLSCDVLVVGGGPAGIAAAKGASSRGAHVILCEREPALGGELDFEGATIDQLAAQAWVRVTSLELGRKSVRVLTDTAVASMSGPLVEAHRYPGGFPKGHAAFRIRPRAIVVATGGVEHGLLFVDNDRPGVTLLGAAERYLGRYGVAVGQRVVIFGNHERIYHGAARLIAAGIGVEGVIDARPTSAIAFDLTKLHRAGVRCLANHAVTRALGKYQVTGAVVLDLEKRESEQLRCDAILVSGGWSPSRLAGAIAESSANTGPVPFRLACHAAASGRSLNDTLKEGFAAGIAAATAVRRGPGQHSDLMHEAATDPEADAPLGAGDPESRVQPFHRAPCDARDEKRQFIDLQNDVTVADLRQALAEGFTAIEHIKRYTTLGVGTEQGTTASALAAATLAELTTRSVSKRSSKVRPPSQPVALATLAGRRRDLDLRPRRQTALHEWHVANGGVLEDMGSWMRPRYYRSSGADPSTAGAAEAWRVRTRGGVLDGSTLGKIEITGAGAAGFLDRLYLNPMSALPRDRAKYGVLLREDGMVLDDGVVLKLAEDRFLATVSSGHAGHVLSHFEFWCDREFAHQDVALTDVTEAWSVIVVAGPTSHDVLSRTLGDAWEARVGRLRHMSLVTGSWQGMRLRVLRASFSGERAYELHCHPAIAESLWTRLTDAGLLPYGLEATDILRLEKGYLVGSEMNGQTTPEDLGMGALVALGNRCIGHELLDRPGLHESDRPRLVGVRNLTKGGKFLAGAQLVERRGETDACGYVTSSALSPSLGEWVGLALVARRIADGAHLVAQDPVRGSDAMLYLTPTVHFDPAGERMKS
jgi:sarcosine oxidase subunit alpha